MVMFPEMRRLRTEVKKEMASLRAEAEGIGPRVRAGMEPAILAAKRELDKEARINGGDSWATIAKTKYLQAPGTFENELRGISSDESKGMEKELSLEIKELNTSFFWARATKAVAFSVFAFISAFSSAEGVYAVAVQKAVPLQQSITLAVSACMAVATGIFLWIGKDSIEESYKFALKQISATRQWMKKKDSEVSETIAKKIEVQKEWWLKSFSGQKQH